MTAFICKTCGVQYADSPAPPARCVICDDERQYPGPNGLEWTTHEALRASGYENTFSELEPGLISIRTRPQFAIGQRAILVQTPTGNVLWDCITHLDQPTVERVQALGGIAAIGISHPHFYASSTDWARTFEAALYLPQADRAFVTDPGPQIRYWEGAVELLPGVTLIQCGGHFEGSAALHWREGAAGGAVLLTGDTIAVAADPRWVTFMRSYPNYIPLPAAEIDRIVATLEPFAFTRLYGGFSGDVADDAKTVVHRSAERYKRWLRGQ